ncbi:MAG: bud neck involved protein [Candelina submexicana]|nr:MAG: bud neck involved protein [Candelina submexicana]
MAAAVQYFPQQQSSTVTMLQAPHPNSASSNFQNTSHISPHQHLPRSSQISRNLYNTASVGLGTGNYRGHTTLSPSVAPYAFTSTPSLMDGANPLRQNPLTPHLRQENRTCSAPVIPPSQQKQTSESFTLNRPRYLAAAPSSTSSTTSCDPPTRSVQVISKDDTSIPSTQSPVDLNKRPASMIGLNGAYSNPAEYSTNSPVKPSPDRYRRVNRRNEPVNTDTSSHQANISSGSALPSGSGMATVGHLYNHPSHANSSPTLHSHQGYGPSSVSQPLRHNSGLISGGHLQGKQASVDDLQAYRQPTTEQAKRYRRRSVSSLDATEVKGSVIESHGLNGSQQVGAGTSAASNWQDLKDRRNQQGAVRPSSAHGRNGSAESDSSARSRSRPSSRESGVLQTPANSSYHITPVSKHEAKLVSIPPRGPAEVNKRLTNPSPLSRPMAMGHESPSSKDPIIASQRSTNAEPASLKPLIAHQVAPESSAAQHLAALNEKEGKKGVKSRLRRAFSFGSAAELRRASAENNLNNTQSVERARLRKERYQDEREQEQAAIAQKQEAGGIGEGIYSGQGHFFTGSTDNLSISSTASSASVMIRKMGKGMKKSSRSLVGLFRPKSVVGVPAAESAVPAPSVGQISMVTVEAEREKVNVNADPHDQAGGGTGFPKLERNSLDAAAAASATTKSIASDSRATSIERGSDENVRGRRSIVGGETERAEVLAAVKKGILKRRGTDSGNSSPVTRPLDARATDFALPNMPQISDTPVSSAPSTPGDEQPPRSGHRRTDSVTIEGEDYFMSLSKFSVGDSKSAPPTPQGIPRNINFSPRIQFYDTWTSMEYDRRGEIATCNRLTPMLAQQIKEELNTFKMEMEVHEQSKVYTHFF